MEGITMAVKGMSVFTQGGEDFTINDPNIADEFNTSTNYYKGDEAYYQGNLYMFTQDHSAGAWNGSHVVQIKVGVRLKELDSLTEDLNNIAITAGEKDLSSATSTPEPPQNNQARFSALEAKAMGGKIKKILFKNDFQSLTATRFYIAIIKNSVITIKKTFVFNTISTKEAYENGIDFSLEDSIEEGMLIGFNIPQGGYVGKYGGTNGSYLIISPTVGNSYTSSEYEKKTYGVGIGCTYENKIVNSAENAEGMDKKDIRFGELNMEAVVATPIWNPNNSSQARFAKQELNTIGGKIKKVFFKSTFNSANPTRFYLGRKNDDGTITMLDTFVISTISTKTEYENGTDFVYNRRIEKHTLIGFSIPPQSNMAYYGGTSGSYTIQGPEIGSTVTPDGENDFGIGVSASVGNVLDFLQEEIEKNTQDITEIEVELQNENVRYGSKIPENINVYPDSDIIHARVIYNSATDSEVRLIRTPNESGVEVSRVDFVKFGTGKIGFYNRCDLPASAALTVFKDYNPGFSFVTGHEYDIMSIRYMGYISQLTITDTWTQETFTATLINDEGNIGNNWGKRFVTAGEGVTVEISDNYMLQPEKSRITIIGDSYIEGNSIIGNKNKRFSALTMKRLKGDGFVWGMGGASSAHAAAWISTILAESESDYYLLNFGMNDSDFDTWKTNMLSVISAITTAGKKVILCTVVPTTLTTNSEHMEINEYIRSQNYDYLDFAKLMSGNHDGETVDTSYLMPDGIHPTVASHQLMFDLFVSTMPQVFGTAIED